VGFGLGMYVNGGLVLGVFLIYLSGRKREKNVSRIRKKTFFKQNMEIINQPIKTSKVKINQTFVWVLPKSF
jgi:hypothetical protein